MGIQPRIGTADSVVDDPDDVCRAEASLLLAERFVGLRDFIRCTLADILDGRAPARRDATSLAVFSAFGLEVLELAVDQLVARRAQQAGRGLVQPDSLSGPEGWRAHRPARQGTRE